MPGGDGEAALAAIEADVRENRRTGDDLIAALTDLAPGFPPSHPTYARYLTLRAVVETGLGYSRPP